MLRRGRKFKAAPKKNQRKFKAELPGISTCDYREHSKKFNLEKAGRSLMGNITSRNLCCGRLNVSSIMMAVLCKSRRRHLTRSFFWF